MFFSFEFLTLTLVAIVNIVIFWLVASQGLRTVSHRYFLVTNFCVVLWILGTAIFLTASTQSIAKLGISLFYIAPMLMISSLALFASVFLEKNTKKITSISNLMLLLLTVVGTIFILSPISPLTEKIQLSGMQSLNILTVNVLWYSIYFAYFNIAEFIAFFRLFKSFNAHNGTEKQQIKFVTYGALLSAITSLFTNLILPLMGYTSLIWVGPSSTVFYVVTVGVSIVRHGLFDIRQTVVRSAAYILSLLVLAGTYYVLAYIVSVIILEGQVSSGVSANPANILLALGLAFIFQPIKRFFDRTTDRLFFRDRYKSDEFYARLSEVLTSTTELTKLLERAAIEIGTTLKAEQSFFYVQYNQKNHVTAGTSHHSSFPSKDVDDLNKHTEAVGSQLLVTSMLPIDHHVKRLLISHKIALALPLVRHDGVVGYLFLGEQKSSGYTDRDAKVLNTVSDELVIAIQNALSVQEVRATNANLEQRIEAATAELRTSNARLKRLDASKDEFLSMASHQLRTPLTSVKGYLSMMLDGDVGKISAMQRQVLEESYSSSERMVHLIHDFLNVSRLQTGKFMLELGEVDLVKLVEEEVKSLEKVAASHTMTLQFTNMAGEVIMRLDDTKLRQVVMNYIDNAIYYSHPDSQISIELSRTDDDIVLKVKDTGIGVPKNEQEHLFSKFYRASNARRQRPDGTGVGIFLAKKVITALGGQIVFDSKEGKGSVFGFRLPIEQDEELLENNSKQLGNHED